MLSFHCCVVSRVRAVARHLMLAGAAAILCVGLLRTAAALELEAPQPGAGMLSGSQIKDIIDDPMALTPREQNLYDEFMKGNIPHWLRQMRPVTVNMTISSVNYTATYWVTPDYLCVGNNTNYFRIPMTPILAQWVANAYNCQLPTRRMVNQIWAATDAKINPQTIAPSADMVKVFVFWNHHQMVATTMSNNSIAPGTFLGGHKKDVVISPLLPTFPSPARVGIYGWHYTNGTTIQPLYHGHESTYADYSHGIRLVHKDMLVNGTTMTVSSVLNHPTLNALLSDEGQVAQPSYPVGAPPMTFPFIDNFPGTGRQLNRWIDRFTTPQTISHSPAAPGGGDGFVLRVRDTSGGIDTTRISAATASDYVVKSWIWCEYRPGLSADGFERVGIFVRDQGTGMFEGQNQSGTIKGNSYALTWDSHTGQVRCLKTVNGVPSEMMPAAIFHASSGWRHFEIEAIGSNLTFRLDGTPVLATTDSAFPSGQFGIGYHEFFTTNANILGTYADRFSADLPTPLRVLNWEQY